jgi:hypothetical protein
MRCRVRMNQRREQNLREAASRISVFFFAFCKHRAFPPSSPPPLPPAEKILCCGVFSKEVNHLFNMVHLKVFLFNMVFESWPFSNMAPEG